MWLSMLPMRMPRPSTVSGRMSDFPRERSGAHLSLPATVGAQRGPTNLGLDLWPRPPTSGLDDCILPYLHQPGPPIANAQFDASFSGWPSAWAFFVGLLQAAYTLTGYGMVAALCEEVRDPVREVPRAMGE